MWAYWKTHSLMRGSLSLCHNGGKALRSHLFLKAGEYALDHLPLCLLKDLPSVWRISLQKPWIFQHHDILHAATLLEIMIIEGCSKTVIHILLNKTFLDNGVFLWQWNHNQDRSCYQRLWCAIICLTMFLFEGI